MGQRAGQRQPKNNGDHRICIGKLVIEPISNADGLMQTYHGSPLQKEAAAVKEAHQRRYSVRLKRERIEVVW
jgi:hypothetical protein